MNGPKLLYKVTTVMAMLDISRSTVYRLVAKSELELVKIGDATRITAESVDGLIERGRAVAGKK